MLKRNLAPLEPPLYSLVTVLTVNIMYSNLQFRGMLIISTGTVNPLITSNLPNF